MCLISYICHENAELLTEFITEYDLESTAYILIIMLWNKYLGKPHCIKLDFTYSYWNFFSLFYSQGLCFNIKLMNFSKIGDKITNIAVKLGHITLVIAAQGHAQLLERGEFNDIYL